MPANSHTRHRRSIRLKGYDYTQAGAYFVTICTHNRECRFGEVVDGKITLNTFGKIVDHQWRQIPRFFPNTALDEFFAMPNHFHGIVMITADDDIVGAKHPRSRIWMDLSEGNRGCFAPTGPSERPHGTIQGSLAAIIQNFISITTRKINRIRKTPDQKLWQRNYFEHIIRNENELNRIREYIQNNPLKWAEDRNNPIFKLM
jgi:putative transposase